MRAAKGFIADLELTFWTLYKHRHRSFLDLLPAIIYDSVGIVNSYILSEVIFMVRSGETVCPKCGGRLRRYGNVWRIVRTKRRDTRWVQIRRLRCEKCHGIHRALPAFIFPYKQYEAEVIIGVLEGFITSTTLGFEDYPCEMTMTRWLAQKSQLL